MDTLTLLNYTRDACRCTWHAPYFRLQGVTVAKRVPSEGDAGENDLPDGDTEIRRFAPPSRFVPVRHMDPNPMLRPRYPLLTTHYSLRNKDYLLLTTQYLLLTTYYLLFTAYYLLLTTH